MIVEPVPTRPRGRGRRWLDRLGLLVPVVALVIVAGLAVAGGTSGTPVAGELGAPERGAVTPAAPSAALPTVLPTPPRDATAAAFPEFALGLPVRSAATTVWLRGGGDPSASGLLAVAGYLSLGTRPADCGDARWPGPMGAWCTRIAILSDSPSFPYARGEDGNVRPWAHLHPQFPAGSRFPAEVLETLPDAAGTPVPVVVIGRFDDPRAIACRQGRHCGEEFVAERVVWFAGSGWPRSTVVDPAIVVDRRDPTWTARRERALSHLDHPSAPLLVAFVTPAGLAHVAPDVHAALLGTVEPAAAGDRRLWYVRGVGPRPPGPIGVSFPGPDVQWVLVDDATGSVLLSGTEVAAPE